VESDIVISSDGIPYIMHDPILARTTNVASVFPGMTLNLFETRHKIQHN
jgi:glycerophosphoryl diester phosphodiesterase